jgi:predicted transcriptional regulator
MRIFKIAKIGPGIDLQNVDLNKSDNEIAHDLGINPSSVAALLRKPKFNLKLIDWTRSAFSIHKETGIKLETVILLKKIEEVGWENYDSKISRETGISIAKISELRHNYVPNTIRNKITTPDLSNTDWSMTNYDIARQLGINPSTVSQYRHDFAPDTVNELSSKYNWKIIDWNMSNRQIAKVLLNQINPGEPQNVKDISQLKSHVSKRRRFLAPENLKQEQPEKQPTVDRKPPNLFHVNPYDRIAHSTFGIFVQ